MVYWRVAELLAARGWTRYRLVQESKLPTTTVYTIAKKDAEVHRIDGHTLDVLCETFSRALGHSVGPGDLLIHKPGQRSRKKS
jgi:DNA-binding Xre family transcriptional regulator